MAEATTNLVCSEKLDKEMRSEAHLLLLLLVGEDRRLLGRKARVALADADHAGVAALDAQGAEGTSLQAYALRTR